MTRRIRNSKKPSRMPVRSWKHQLLLLCFLELGRRIVGVFIQQNWDKTCMCSGNWWIHKAACGTINAQSSWRPYCRKRKWFTAALWFGSKSYSYASSLKNSSSKGSGGRGVGKFGEKFGVGDLTKVRSKKEVIDEARTLGAKVHFASLMDTCHMKNAELEVKAQKILRSSCIQWWCCKRRFRVWCSIHWTRIFSISKNSI